MPTTDAESIVSMGDAQPEKEDPTLPGRKGRGIRLLPSPQSCMPHHIDGMAQGQLSK